MPDVGDKEGELAEVDVPKIIARTYTPIKDQKRKEADLRGHDAGFKPNMRKKLTRW